MLRSALYPSLQNRDTMNLPSTMMEYSIPSLLLSHGASMSNPILTLGGVYTGRGFPTSTTLLRSHLSYLVRLPTSSAHLQAEFLRHLDIDSISELTRLDIWFTSIWYHTSTDFRNALQARLETTKKDILPLGILDFPEICKQLKTAEEAERNHFFEFICTYGTRENLEPFIVARFETPQQPLEWSIPKHGTLSLRFPSWYEIPAHAFTNVETFESIAAAGIRISDFKVVLKVMSSSFILERVRDRAFLESFFGLWSPSGNLRPLVLAYWVKYLNKCYMVIGDTHRAMVDALIDRDYCSFPSRTSPTQRIRTTTTFLAVEVTCLVCEIIRPRTLWVIKYLREEKNVMLLLYMLEKYRAFMELELDRRWLPEAGDERWLGFTPLMLAVAAGDFRLVVLLVEHGAIITQPHTSRNLSALDLAHRNICCCHPRNWLELPPSELDKYSESDTMISEETDEKILDFLVKKSKQSQDLVHTPELRSDCKLIPLGGAHPC